MRKTLRVLYALTVLVLFLGLITLGVALILRPDLDGEYARPVLASIVAGAVILFVFDMIARRMR